MLEYLGVEGKKAFDVALAAGHDLQSNNAEDISKTVWAIRDILPDNHPLKASDINYFRCGRSHFGMLIKPDTIIDTDTQKFVLPDGNYARVEGEIIDFKFSEAEFLKTSLEKNGPVLAKIICGNAGRFVLITGIDYKEFSIPESLKRLPIFNMLFPDGVPAYAINAISYWDKNRGEVIEDFKQEFSRKVVSYAGFDITH